MDSTPTLSRLHVVGTQLLFSYAVLLALGASFIWADGHDQQRCVEIVIIGLALAFALASGVVGRAAQLVPAVPRGLCLTFLALGAIGSIGVVSPSHALAEWSMFVLLGLGAMVVAAEIVATGTPGMNRLLQMLGLICALYSLRVLLIYGAGLSQRIQFDFQALAAGFSNIRFLNHTQTALLPLLLLACRGNARTRFPAKAIFLVTAFWWSLIFLAESRATTLALVTGSAIVWLLRGRRAKGWLLTMAASAAAGLVLYLVLYFAIPLALGMRPLSTPLNILERTEANPISNRQFLWRRALDLIEHHPLLGVGPQHFAHFGSDLQTGAHPHDWLLQIGTEWGIPALLCLVAILLLGMRALIRAAKQIAPEDTSQQDIATTLIVALTAIAVDGVFSGVLVMPQSQLAIALVAGITIGWVRSLGGAAVAVTAPVTRYVTTLLGLVALAIAIAVIGPDIDRKWQGAPLNAQERAHNGSMHWPRLWEAGYF